jgi:photosystem II stability/assembly factor-like uncharacterized protein
MKEATMECLKTLVWLAVLACGGSWPAALGQSQPAEPYVWRNVAMGGGGFVTGIVFHPMATNLIYARTDVGGAYRWDDAAHKWLALTDWIGPADNNFMGIESVALDPADPQRVYLAAGTYSSGNSAILRSADQGQTFARTDVPFKMGGNETGRFNGERLAVDPHDGGILFFGSRFDGLWKSGDHGATWANVASFPRNIEPPGGDVRAATRHNFGPPPAVGIVSVVFDPASGQPGGATPGIYAAVSTTGTNLFASTDAGATWRAVAGQPVGLRPNHLVLSPEGVLYLTYGREPGPNTMSDGAVWKYDPPANTWTDITPLKSPDANNTFGYGAVAVDTQHPATLMVTTFAHWHPHDLIFRSPDRGAHWTQLWREDTEWNYAAAPYVKTRAPHWMGTIVINPHDSDQVLLTTGYGIWNCVNASRADAGAPTRWTFLDEGLEETVPLALISPPEGAHLLSGVGDIDGFVHDRLDVSPPQGTFAGPRFVNTEDLAFAGQDPRLMVRAGTVNNQDVRAMFSRDGGQTWRELESEPPTGNGAGTITLSADGQVIVWTPLGGRPYLTRDLGSNWLACAGLATGLRVTADAMNPQIFYALNPRSGEFCVSTNGAASFTVAATVLDPAPGYGYSFRGASVVPTPGLAGDVWIASPAQGLFHTTNGGASFAHVPGVPAADSLGMGRAAPGQPYPALFLAGQVGMVQALFRSDDAGETWTRINDRRHQYGWISHVTGDPRVYGRVYFATPGRGVIYGEIR